MQNDFTYALVSNVNKGGNFMNTCNESLDFQTRKYEVCMQDMLVTVGAWDNVRDGNNQIIVKTSHLPDIIAYIKPGRYIQLPESFLH